MTTCVSGVHQGVCPDQSTQATTEPARSFLKQRYILKMSLDELDKGEMFVNQGKFVAKWPGIRVYEPEHQENGETIWHLRKNPSDKLHSIMTIRIYDEHAFLTKDAKKLARVYKCVDYQVRFTKAWDLQRQQNMFAWENGYHLPKRESRCPADLL